MTEAQPAVPQKTIEKLPPVHLTIWRDHLSLINAIFLATILLVATLLRFYHLDASSLWSDEGNTWALVGRSFAQIARDAAGDIHPPGYYWALKIWTALFGTSAMGIRSFSAVAGILLTYVIYQIGRHTGHRNPGIVIPALLAAFIGAVNPFQIYYSQEARMYILLALESAGLFWGLLVLMHRQRTHQAGWSPALWFVVCGAAGLWTHYSFSVVLAAAGLAYFVDWIGLSRELRTTGAASPYRLLARYALLNMIILLAFVPWIPTAIERVLNWPKGGETVRITEALRLTLNTFVFGPLRDIPEPTWPWLLAAGILPLVGLVALRHHRALAPLGFWLLAPIFLMLGLGLFSDAFLKFLLVASPAWCLLIAVSPYSMRSETGFSLLIAAGACILALLTLPAYYHSPTARDNYAGIARYLDIMGIPETDLVVLDAPGQQDVWRYYDSDIPWIALPSQRPPDASETTGALSQKVEGRSHVYALFWATNEADPDGIVETWLDQNAFRGLESWQGNLRFAAYTVPDRMTCRDLQPAPLFDSRIALESQCHPAFPQQVSAGQVALVQLHWRTESVLDERYKVTVQLLDHRNQVVAQHDTEPAGGSQPTDTWHPGVAVIDNHGIAVPPGTPPGLYRLIVALYDPATGQRLSTSAGDQVALGNVEVIRANKNVPLELLSIPHGAGVVLDPLTLVGYDLHHKGYSHAPDTPVRPGDQVHLTLYWQAPDPLPETWPDDQIVTIELGDQRIDVPLAGGNYPTANWQPGEVVRGEFDITYDGSGSAPVIRMGAQDYRLRQVPGG